MQQIAIDFIVKMILIAVLRWGILDSSKEEDRNPAKWDVLFAAWREEGYSAIEACMGPFNPFAGKAKELRELLERHGLVLVAQVRIFQHAARHARML